MDMYTVVRNGSIVARSRDFDVAWNYITADALFYRNGELMIF